MRALMALALVCLSFAAHAAEEFQVATILDAGTHRETDGAVMNVFGGINNTEANVSVVVLQIGTLKVTAEYETMFHGKRAASNMIVGDTVQARTDGKWLHFVGPSGKVIKAKVMRQERI
jgi:hypothetical protein